MLTSKNKSKLPPNSHPGVYLINCKCGKKYVGETKLKVSTKVEQHKKNISDQKWHLSGVTNHAEVCDHGFDWTEITTLKIEKNNSDRKVREIQFQDTSSRS